ncbi:multiple sugar transport system permease protein [Paenibacillus castaneae]|uniref:carbohydrate ABC transporter permease n=1 Tax=Paenibacillus castaneae TaxID=474957 RepID=UPI00141BE13D|nr:carbohydrate ABC transporter permease [Paenibacillus castaneae]NIK75292.1 multiple sugar transport system permease protein [Paenibacillus castaneae]
MSGVQAGAPIAAKGKRLLNEKLRNKYFKLFFVNRLFWAIMRYLLLIGLAFLILYPLLVKLSNSFMSAQDLIDGTVRFVPRQATWFNYETVFKHTSFLKSLSNTFLISFMSGALQMLVCTMVGYGLARFNFKGKGIVFTLVVLTILIPPQTYMISLYMKFSFFDIFGLMSAISGGSIRLMDSMWPMAILSIIGFGFKNGLYILIMRQYFKGIPKELEEAAYVDGSGLFRTFARIILPISFSMMITIFIFSFAWQWTDSFYSSMFFSQLKLLSSSLLMGFEGLMLEGNTLGLKPGQPLTATLTNTMSLLIITPLIILYLFAQKYLVEGIEHSGIVG